MSDNAGATAVIVHEYFIQDGGAEQCAIEFSRLLPAAKLRTTFFDHDRFGTRITPERVQPWPLQRLLGATRHFRSLLPIYPLYFGSMRVNGADLVLTSSIAFTKAVRTPPGVVHLSYVYTPMRYAWDLDTYLTGSSYGRLTRAAARLLRWALQRWDRRTATRPTVIVAISETVKARIRDRWGRESEVIYPPVNVDEIHPTGEDEGFYLVAARMLSYRRLDLAVEACSRLERSLVVVGDGPERERLERLAGPTVRFLGHVERERLVRLFQTCRAYLVPGIEDFGIAPVEAMAAGKPVVAFAGGGAAETVVDGTTGVLVAEATADAFADAIASSERIAWDPVVIRAQAEKFDRRVFVERWRELIRRVGGEHHLAPMMAGSQPEPENQ